MKFNSFILVFLFSFYTINAVAQINWEPANVGLDNENEYYYSITASDNGIFYLAGSDDNSTSTSIIYKSNDEGETWDEIQSVDLESLEQINAILSVDDILIIAGSDVLISNDDGETWEVSMDGINPSHSITDMTVSEEGVIYLSGYLAIPPDYLPVLYKSDDQGATWNEIVFSALEELSTIRSITSIDDKLIIGGGTTIGIPFESAILISDTEGATWTVSNSGFNIQEQISDFSSSENGVIYLTSSEGPTTPPILYKTIDGGDTWEQIESIGLNDIRSAGVIEISNDLLISGGQKIELGVGSSIYRHNLITSVENNEDVEFNEISLSPNPLKNQELYIRNNNKIDQVKIYNSTGTLMLEKNTPANKEVIIQTDNLNSGIYVVLVKVGEDFYSKKILVL